MDGNKKSMMSLGGGALAGAQNRGEGGSHASPIVANEDPGLARTC
jgi:hypothetical protein